MQRFHDGKVGVFGDFEDGDFNVIILENILPALVSPAHTRKKLDRLAAVHVHAAVNENEIVGIAPVEQIVSEGIGIEEIALQIVRFQKIGGGNGIGVVVQPDTAPWQPESAKCRQGCGNANDENKCNAYKRLRKKALPSQRRHGPDEAELSREDWRRDEHRQGQMSPGREREETEEENQERVQD